jgi:hypothetical protein
MKPQAAERIEELRRQGERERAELAVELAALRHAFEERRRQLRFAGTAVTAIATAGTVLYKIFGRASLAYRVGRIATAAGVLFQLGRAAFKTKRFW